MSRARAHNIYLLFRDQFEEYLKTEEGIDFPGPNHPVCSPFLPKAIDIFEEVFDIIAATLTGERNPKQLYLLSFDQLVEKKNQDDWISDTTYRRFFKLALGQKTTSHGFHESSWAVLETVAKHPEGLAIYRKQKLKKKVLAPETRLQHKLISYMQMIRSNDRIKSAVGRQIENLLEYLKKLDVENESHLDAIERIVNSGDMA